jgi:hypothetical protein
MEGVYNIRYTQNKNVHGKRRRQWHGHWRQWRGKVVLDGATGEGARRVTLAAAEERGGHRDGERHGQEARGGGHVVGDMDGERRG